MTLKDKRQVIEGIVKTVASRSGLITYGDILTLLGYASNDKKALTELADILGDLSVEETKLGHPFISVLVVNKGTGHCGSGFFRLAERKGVKRADQADAEFFIEELNRTHRFWRISKLKALAASV